MIYKKKISAIFLFTATIIGASPFAHAMEENNHKIQDTLVKGLGKQLAKDITANRDGDRVKRNVSKLVQDVKKECQRVEKDSKKEYKHIEKKAKKKIRKIF